MWWHCMCLAHQISKFFFISKMLNIIARLWFKINKTNTTIFILCKNRKILVLCAQSMTLHVVCSSVLFTGFLKGCGLKVPNEQFPAQICKTAASIIHPHFPSMSFEGPNENSKHNHTSSWKMIQVMLLIIINILGSFLPELSGML